jgi:predicted secreted protein
MILNKDDNGRDISISIGSILEIELSTPAGTGYEWSVSKLEQEYLELMREEKIVAQMEDNKVGQPVVKKWYLRARRAGGTEVIMGLYRSWEGKSRPSDLFRIHIDISLMPDKER